MLFKNLKTGNFVEPKDAATAEMMERSPNYEAVTAKAAAATVPAPEAPKPTKKPAKGGKEKTAE